LYTFGASFFPYLIVFSDLILIEMLNPLSCLIDRQIWTFQDMAWGRIFIGGYFIFVCFWWLSTMHNFYFRFNYFWNRELQRVCGNIQRGMGCYSGLAHV